MSNYLSEENKCHHMEQHKTIVGNSVNVNIKKCDSDIRADVVVSEHKSIRLWGQVKNREGLAVGNALVKLLKIIYSGSRIVYQSVASTISDSEGFYQFDLVCPLCEDSTYKVLVGKSFVGIDKVAPLIDEIGNLYEDDLCRPMEKKKCYEGTNNYSKSSMSNNNQY